MYTGGASASSSESGVGGSNGAEHIEFRLLGQLEVVIGGCSVPLGGAKQRAVLAVLVLSANEVVPFDRLIDEVWGESPPGSGRAALQVRVSQLRKALGPAARQLQTRGHGYVLRVEAGQLDLHLFEKLVSEAEQVDPIVAARKLREALGLWRDEPLADLRYEPFAQAAIARLDELRLMALEKRIESDLSRGRHDDLIAELYALVAEHPLRERLHQQLMLALYRSGRQADALAVFHRARAQLNDQLGLEPGPGLVCVQRAILTHDRSLEPEHDVAAKSDGVCAVSFTARRRRAPGGSSRARPRRSSRRAPRPETLRFAPRPRIGRRRRASAP
jgi:DNA-binding SARP family transcriptional activator